MNDILLRDELVKLLKGGQAHLNYEDILREYSLDKINSKHEKLDYTPWQLLEHIKIAQWDILEFIKNPDHVSPDWPGGYWPNKNKADETMWLKSCNEFISDLNEMIEITKNLKIDISSNIPHTKDYTYFREIILVADHNAYHFGQLIVLMKSL